MTESVDENPLEPILDLFVYAPVGLLYEYDEVLATLVKRGKSQVQLAKFVGQMALKQQRAGSGLAVGSPEGLAGTLTQLVSEAASLLGLGGLPPRPGGNSNPKTTASEPVASNTPAPSEDGVAAPLAIEGYDELTAREIISLLAELTAKQRSDVRAHEEANRARKTILAKLDRLESS